MKKLLSHTRPQATRGSKQDRAMRAPIVLVLFFTLSLVIAGCSSLPVSTAEPEQTSIRSLALEYAKLGDESLKNRDYPKAEENYRLSLDANASVDSLDGMSQAYNSLGNLFLGLGRYADATNAFDNAKAQAKLLNDPRLTALALSNSAKVLLAQAKPEEALVLLDEALALVKGQEDAAVAVMHHNQGVAFKDLGRLDEAKTAIKQSLAINDKLKTLRERASNHYLLASIASKESKLEDALVELGSALELDKKAENSEGIAADLYALATLYGRKTETSELQTAWGYAIRAFTVALAANDAASVERSLNQLVAFAAKLGYQAEGSKYAALLEKLSANKRKATDSATTGAAQGTTK